MEESRAGSYRCSFQARGRAFVISLEPSPNLEDDQNTVVEESAAGVQMGSERACETSQHQQGVATVREEEDDRWRELARRVQARGYLVPSFPDSLELE